MATVKMLTTAAAVELIIDAQLRDARIDKAKADPGELRRRRQHAEHFVRSAAALGLIILTDGP